MEIKPEEIQSGTKLLIKHLENLVVENPELGSLHDAFEHYCANKYSLGSTATTQRTGGGNDLGIDFFSVRGRAYHVGQCKIPARDWMEANESKVKKFGVSVVDDPRDALRYLLGESKAMPNERVRYLYGLVADDRNHDDFSLSFFLIVYGRLDKRAGEAFNELKSDYEKKNVRLILQEMPELVDEFLVGSARATDEINMELRTASGSVLRYRDYCYFLANAADLYRAFQQYGWRLFDLNLRYEVRNSSVNGDIVNSLSHHRSRKNFHHYNNGLIIITKSYSLRDSNSKVRLAGAQIVNGLQTVKSIYNAVSMKEVTPDELDHDCVVQVKAISTNEPEFTSQVVQSTNNQNPMAPRNLKANNREQKILRTDFASLNPRWFLQVKEGEWDSLTQEAGRFFKQVVGYSATEFRPEAQKRKGRVIDNQEAAKAWLAFMGFADIAGEQTSHYFASQEVYEMAFQMRPSVAHWNRFAESVDFNAGRLDTLERQQGSAAQYLLAHFLWQFTRNFIPSSQQFRKEALEEGVKANKIRKASGEIISSEPEQDAYLAENPTYQTWRLMTNMKELIVEVASQVIIKRYGQLDSAICLQLLQKFDAKDFLTKANTREVAQEASKASDLEANAVFSRIFGLLRYASAQFWEEKRKSLLTSSRIRLVLLRREVASDFKSIVWEVDKRKMLEKVWKPEGKTFLESLPSLN
jgi:hypothetical protein